MIVVIFTIISWFSCAGIAVIFLIQRARIRELEKMPCPWITTEQTHRLYSRYGKEAEEIMNIMRDKNHRIAGEDDDE